MAPSESPMCRAEEGPILLLSVPLDAVPPRLKGGDLHISR